MIGNGGVPSRDSGDYVESESEGEDSEPNDESCNINVPGEEVKVRKLKSRPPTWHATNGEYNVLGSSKPQVLENFATRLRQLEDGE